MTIKARQAVSLDSLIFDKGVAETRRNEVIRHRMVELEFEEKDKLRLEEYRQALKEKKPPKPFQWKELSQGERHDRYFHEASKFADDIIKEERFIFAKSREQDVLKLLKRIRNTLKLFMFVADEEGNIIKPTFVHRTIDSMDGVRHESFADVFGERDYERPKIVERLTGQASHIAYLLPYSSPEIKALYAEVMEIATPDHIEGWRNDQIGQVFGGKYAKEDQGLDSKKWLKKVSKRAKKLIAERAKVAEKEVKSEG